MKKIFLLFVSVFMIGCMAYGETGKVVHVTKSEFVEKFTITKRIQISGSIKEISRPLSILCRLVRTLPQTVARAGETGCKV